MASSPEAREKVAQLQELVAKTEGLAITGAWVAGSGLAAVIPHALKVV